MCIYRLLYCQYELSNPTKRVIAVVQGITWLLLRCGFKGLSPRPDGSLAVSTCRVCKLFNREAHNWLRYGVRPKPQLNIWTILDSGSL
jgi:hypothetical protein